MKQKRTFFQHLLLSFLSLSIMGILLLCLAYIYLQSQLPDISELNNAKMQVPLRVLTSDGKLIAEFGEKRRIPIQFNQVPKPMIDAILATEDKRFFEHSGVDFLGLMRASVELIATGEKKQGGSTITMQVARNFFLSRKKTYMRKIREILLAINIDRELSKEKIMELYLNKIFFGNHAYGVAAAAQIYYGKPLDQLSLGQYAMLAGLPKAPSTLNPIVNPVAAKDRRDHVLERMFTMGFITKPQYEAAMQEPIKATYHGQTPEIYAPYVAEMVRQIISTRYGEDAYSEGFNVYTTIDSHQQEAATQALRNGLIAYDRRHGYVGPEANLGKVSQEALPALQEKLESFRTVDRLEPGVVLSMTNATAEVLLKNGSTIEIPWSGLSWAKRALGDNTFARMPSRASDVVAEGDVIRVIKGKNGWELSELPSVQGSIVAIRPSDGAITAMVGGFDFGKSSFNRAIQSARQPGSNFKPFIYSAALDHGFTLASVINDAPVVLNAPGDEEFWRPQNNEKKFYGPTRLRVGLIRSRNLVSIRLLEAIGIPYAVNYVQRFGFDPDKVPHTLSLALGTANVSPLEVATGYAVFANGGYKVMPYIIGRIVDDTSRTIYQAQPKTACAECQSMGLSLNDMELLTNFADGSVLFAPQVISPQTVFMMNSVLQDVISHGTATGARVLNRKDIAGKTGTTQNQNDAWFSGYSPDIAVTVWVGYDQLKSLYEFGAQAALPIWVDFMRQALDGKPEKMMVMPPGIVSVKIDPRTGLLASDRQRNAIFEFFRESDMPNRGSPYPMEQNPYAGSTPNPAAEPTVPESGDEEGDELNQSNTEQSETIF